jgi:hypothetical protein
MKMSRNEEMEVPHTNMVTMIFSPQLKAKFNKHGVYFLMCHEQGADKISNIYLAITQQW